MPPSTDRSAPIAALRAALPAAVRAAPPASTAAATSDLAWLLTPRSVAIIGASDDPLRIGGRPIATMLLQGYGGRILPVNPGRQRVQGLEAFASVAALPEAPQVAIVAVAAAQTVRVVEELAALGTRAALVFSAGYAEAGTEGALLQDRMVAAARAHGMRLLGPNTLGLINPRNGFYGTFTSVVDMGFPQPGGVAIASQSGAYGGHILSIARDHDIGIASCVMTGNEADITLGDVIAMQVADAHTEVIAVYAEGIRDGTRFVAALDAARRAKCAQASTGSGRCAGGLPPATSAPASKASMKAPSTRRERFSAKALSCAPAAVSAAASTLPSHLPLRRFRAALALRPQETRVQEPHALSHQHRLDRHRQVARGRAAARPLSRMPSDPGKLHRLDRTTRQRARRLG